MAESAGADHHARRTSACAHHLEQPRSTVLSGLIDGNIGQIGAFSRFCSRFPWKPV